MPGRPEQGRRAPRRPRTEHSTVCQFTIVTRTALHSVRTSSRLFVIKRPAGADLLEHCSPDATIRTFHLQETERGSRDGRPGALALVLRDLPPASTLARFDFNVLVRDVGLSVQAEGGAKRGRGAVRRSRVGPAAGRVHASAWGQGLLRGRASRCGAGIGTGGAIT